MHYSHKEKFPSPYGHNVYLFIPQLFIEHLWVDFTIEILYLISINLHNIFRLLVSPLYG